MVTILLNSRHTYWPMYWFNEHSADKIAWSMSVRGSEPAHGSSEDSQFYQLAIVSVQKGLNILL